MKMGISRVLFWRDRWDFRHHGRVIAQPELGFAVPPADDEKYCELTACRSIGSSQQVLQTIVKTATKHICGMGFHRAGAA
jgi:hypothetical protein